MKYDFSTTVGREFDFYGVDSNMFKLNDQVFEALEDEGDGYRSYLETIKVVTPHDGIFFDQPITRVRCRKCTDEDFDGWVLLDATDDHQWLKVGTDNSDDYYPHFTFQYNVKPDPNPVMEEPIA